MPFSSAFQGHDLIERIRRVRARMICGGRLFAATTDPAINPTGRLFITFPARPLTGMTARGSSQRAFDRNQ